MVQLKSFCFILGIVFCGLATAAEYGDELHLASETGNVALLESLIQKGADIQQNLKPTPPIHVAVLNDQLAFVKRLLEAGVPVDMKDYDGFRPVTLAVQNASVELVKLLVEHGADLNAVDVVDEKTYELLNTAAIAGKVENLKYLLSKGLDVDSASEELNTPLIMAALYGNDDAVEILIQNGAQIEFRNFQGNTALIAAVFREHHSTAALLLKYGADVNVVNNDQNSPMILAARNYNTRIIKLLIKYGVDVNFRDKVGHRPITLAARSGKNDIVRLLIDAGADLDVADGNHMTAIASAYSNNHVETQKLLALAGATHGSGKDHQGIPGPHIPKVEACIWFKGVLKRFGLSTKQTVGPNVGMKACDFLATNFKITGSIVKLLDMISSYGYKVTVDKLMIETFLPEGKDPLVIETAKAHASENLRSMHQKDYKESYKQQDEDEFAKSLPATLRRFGADVPPEPTGDELDLEKIAEEKTTRKQVHKPPKDQRPNHFQDKTSLEDVGVPRMKNSKSRHEF